MLEAHGEKIAQLRRPRIFALSSFTERAGERAGSLDTVSASSDSKFGIGKQKVMDNQHALPTQWSPVVSGGPRWLQSLKIFFQPSACFREIEKHPICWFPIALTVMVKTVQMYVFFSPRRTPVGVILTAAMTVVPSIFPVLVGSGVFLLALYIAGAETTFRKVFSVLSHTFFLYTAVTVALAIAVRLATHGTGGDGVQNLATNLGFLVDKNHFALHYLVGSLDAIVFYHIYLIALGLSTVAEKVRFRLALSIVVLFWLFYVGAGVVVKLIVA